MTAPVRKSNRQTIEVMAEVWLAVPVLLYSGHCLRRGKVVYRIVGINYVNGEATIVKIMPGVFKSLDGYPEDYPMYAKRASEENGLHRNEKFRSQMISLGLMREGDILVR